MQNMESFIISQSSLFYLNTGGVNINSDCS